MSEVIFTIQQWVAHHPLETLGGLALAFYVLGLAIIWSDRHGHRN